MNNAINEIKNTLEATNSRIREAEDRINEVENRMVEINESKREKKGIERNEDSLRDFYRFREQSTDSMQSLSSYQQYLSQS